MALPFKPSDLNAILVQPEDDLGTALAKTEKGHRLAYEFMQYCFTESLTISDPFCAQIKACIAAAQSAATTTTTTT